MYKFFILIPGVILFFSCQKNNTSNPDPVHPPRPVSDTLMVYAIKNTNGTSSLLRKSFKSGETKTLLQNAASPFASNLRVVYIRNGNILGFSRFDGTSRSIAQLTLPSSPCLTVDTRLIAVIDKTPDKYQLLVFDTLGHKIPLFETPNEISSLSFTNDGQNIVFAQKTTSLTSEIFIIPVNGGARVN